MQRSTICLDESKHSPMFLIISKISFIHIIYNALPNSTSTTEASGEPILNHFPEETITQILALIISKNILYYYLFINP